MRIFFYADEPRRKHQEMIERLEKERLTIVDYIRDLDEAEYHAMIRNYDIFVIKSKRNMRGMSTLLKEVRDSKLEDSKIIFFGEDCDKNTIDFYLDDYQFVETGPWEELFRIVSKEISYGGIRIRTDKVDTIFIEKDGEEKAIKIKKADFMLLTYFLRHHDSKINISVLVDAIMREPEMAKPSVVETSISSIRKFFTTTLGMKKPIHNYKKVGYLFSI